VQHPASPFSDPAPPSWQAQPTDKTYIQIRIRRNTLIAVIGSLLVHVLVLLWLSLHPRQEIKPDAQTLVVQLNIPSQKQAPAVIQPESKPKPQTKPSHKHISPPPTSRQQPLKQTAAAVEKPVLSKPDSVPLPRPTPNPAPAMDMLAYVNAARERRRQTELEAAQENAAAVARERGPSEDEIRAANLKRNLQPQGTNGVFQILSMDKRNATFSFHGWRGELSYSHSETYQVEATANLPLERAIIRKMIEIIRRYYDGDFNWESQRQQRVVVLSARPEDNAGLEDFLIKEFFGAGNG
jgi:hypothetical protein